MWTIYSEYILLGINELIKIIECIQQTNKNKVKIFRKGSGILNKYLIYENKKITLLKKTNPIINHRINILANKIVRKKREESMSQRFDNLKKLMKYQEFKKNTLLQTISKQHITYNFIAGAKNLEEIKLSTKERMKVFNDVKKISKFIDLKGFYNQELAARNILYHNKKIYLIDVEGIVNKTNENFEKQINELKNELKL